MDYSDYVKVNPDDLEEEWVHFPSRYMEVIEESVQARIRVDELKDLLDLCKAKLESEIRSDPESFGLSKVTENAISNAVEVHPKHLKAKAEYLQARKTMMIAQGAIDAMAAKRKSLENIVELQISGLYAEPRGSRAVQQAVKEQTQTRSHRRIRERLNRKEE